MSHPTRGGWIEIGEMQRPTPADMSHPTRGGWIEIFVGFQQMCTRWKSYPTQGSVATVATHPTLPLGIV